MFWRNGNKIPQNLIECTASDDVAEDLQLWASRIYSAATAISAIIVALGVIVTFSTVKELHHMDEDVVFTAGFSTAVTWLLYAAVAFIACRLLSLLIEAAATVTQNTAICAKTALYQASKQEKPKKETTKKEKPTGNLGHEEENVPPYYCGRCGKHGPYDGVCPRCGSDLKHFNE